MTGPEALAYLKRRLGVSGVTQDQWTDPDDFYDYITEGRDEILQVFSLAAPVVVRELVTLTDNGDDTWTLTGVTPYRVLEVRAVTGKQNLIPTVNLEQDAGDYEWVNVTKLRAAEHVSPPGGMEAWVVPAGDAIDAATVDTTASWGIPSTLHRAAVKYAAVLALTEDEGSDPQAAMAAYTREIGQLERVYSEFDGLMGVALREATLMNYGQLMGEHLY